MTLENIYGIVFGASILLAAFVFALIKRRYDRQPEAEPIPVRNEPQRLTKHPAFGRPEAPKVIPRPTLVAPPARNSGARTTYAQRSDDKDYEVISPYDPRSPLYHVMTAPQDNPATVHHSTPSDHCPPSSSSGGGSGTSYDSGSSSSYDSGSSSSCDSGSSSSGGSD